MSRKSGSRPSRRKTTPPADVSSRAPSDECPPRGRVMLSGAPSEKLGFGFDVRLAVDELPHDRISSVLDLAARSDLPYPPLVQHRDARPDVVRAAHVMGDDDAR